jgi:hypothetical protein
VPATVVETNPDDDVRSPACPASPVSPTPLPVPTATGAATDPPLPLVGVIVGCCRLCVEAAPIAARRGSRGRDDLADRLRITVSR